jgi:two-component system chemotaxis sensor kinase CheA
VREEIIPYVYLREFFETNGKRPDIEQVVITDLAGKRVGFVVDKVIGQHQTVIKNLGNMYKATEGISGATILGDGSVALILDTHKLIQQAETHEQAIVM